MGIDEYRTSGRVHPRWRPVMLNPLGPFTYLRSPNVLVVAIAGYLLIFTYRALLIFFPFIIGERYGVEAEAITRACFLLDIGGAAGAMLSGWISDKVIVKSEHERGSWYPEDRLRASLFGIFLPITAPAPALVARYIPGTLGLLLSFLCLFLNRVAIDAALTPCSAYLVDVLRSNSVEVTAAVDAFRTLVFSISVMALLPIANTHGYIFTSSIAALLALSSFGLLYLTILYGGSMRAWADIGFSNNSSD